ncbi:MAG TPA: hypothetical protein VFB75_18060 [Burkholderiales bacterium]|nr:hypothetical protein [Burkholderiales bacterium]
MKVKSIIGVAVAGAFAWSAGAHAGWFGDKFGKFFHGDKHAASGSMWNGYEVRTPSSVNESAPWLANEPHMAAASAYHSASANQYSFESGSYGTGASSSASGFGTGGFDSMHMNYGNSGSTSLQMRGYGSDMSFGNPEGTPYWLMGD